MMSVGCAISHLHL